MGRGVPSGARPQVSTRLPRGDVEGKVGPTGKHRSRARAPRSGETAPDSVQRSRGARQVPWLCRSSESAHLVGQVSPVATHRSPRARGAFSRVFTMEPKALTL